jgi:F-type H+-transporting ATPase subunit b
VSINVSELIWTILCFFVLLFVLKKLLIDPLLKVMDARNANVAEGLEAGRQAQLAREENDEALQQAKKDAAQQANVLVQEAKSADEKARQSAVAEAKQSAAQSMKDTREQLHAEEQAVSAELEQELPALVETLAAALLKEAR